MAKGWKLGHVYKYNGEKVVVAAINSDGTLTLNYAAGSGKTGYAGKIVDPSRLDEVKADSFTVPEVDVEGDGALSYADYAKLVDSPHVGEEVKKPLEIGDTLVTHSRGNVGKIMKVDDKHITQKYLEKNFPDFNGDYVGFAVQYEMDAFNIEGKPVKVYQWTTVVELTEDGVTRRYVIEKNKDEEEE